MIYYYLFAFILLILKYSKGTLKNGQLLVTIGSVPYPPHFGKKISLNPLPGLP